MQVRAEAVRPTPLVALLRARPALRSRVDLSAGFLGALAAAGLLLLVTVGVALLTVVIGTTQWGAGTIGSALTEATFTSSLLMAGLLAAMVLVPFALGGYVAARLSTTDPRTEAVVVWAWAVLPLFLGALAALVSGGAARHALAIAVGDPAGTVLVLSGLALSLLGALLGADTARRRRPLPTP